MQEEWMHTFLMLLFIVSFTWNKIMFWFHLYLDAYIMSGGMLRWHMYIRILSKCKCASAMCKCAGAMCHPDLILVMELPRKNGWNHERKKFFRNCQKCYKKNMNCSNKVQIECKLFWIKLPATWSCALFNCLCATNENMMKSPTNIFEFKRPCN